MLITTVNSVAQSIIVAQIIYGSVFTPFYSENVLILRSNNQLCIETFSNILNIYQTKGADTEQTEFRGVNTPCPFLVPLTQFSRAALALHGDLDVMFIRG